MALQLGALRDALLSANAPADKASAAAEEVAGYERELSHLKRDMAVLRRMVGGLYPLVVAILLKLLST